MRALIAVFCLLAVTVTAQAESSTNEQKLVFAQKQLNGIVAPLGYNIVEGSITMRRSARVDFQALTETFGMIFGSEGELRVISFLVQKDGKLFRGWTYLVSSELDPATPINAFGMVNNTAERIKGAKEDSEYSYYTNSTELYLLKTVWSEEAPTINDLHLKVW